MKIMAEAPRSPMEGGGLEKLLREITCTLCHKHYQDPKVLPCCHYFCSACLQTLQTQAEMDNFECPECKTVVEGCSDLDRLPSALFVDHFKLLYSRLEKLEGKEEAPCEMCLEPKAVAFCQQCSEFICSDCLAAHRKMKAKFFGHQIHTLEDLKNSGGKMIPTKLSPPTKCTEHNEPCKLHCLDCHKLICRDCIVIEHAQHHFNFINKSAKDCKGNLNQCLRPLKELNSKFADSMKQIAATRGEISSQGAHVTEHIRKKFAQMYEVLKQREVQLLNMTEGMVKQKIECLDKQGGEIERELVCMQTLMDYVQKNLNVVSDEELLSVQYELKTKMEQATLKHNETDLIPTDMPNLAVKITCQEELARLSTETTAVYNFPMVKQAEVHVAEIDQETTHFVIDTSDTNHSLTHPIKAILKSLVDNSLITGEVFKSGKGLYEVTYTPRIRGQHELHISTNGEAIPGSPFRVFVNIPPTKLGPTPIRVITGLVHPYAAVFDKDQHLLVTESSGNKIRKLLRDEGGSLCDTPGQFVQLDADSPTGLAIDKRGSVYVASASSHSISKYTKEGKCVIEGGREGSRVGQFGHPCGMAVIENEVYICDRNNSRVQVFNRDLQPVRSFGTHGTQQGQLHWPYDITRDEQGLIYVSDCENHRIQVFDKVGEFVQEYGSRGSEPGKLKRPMGVCVGKDKQHLFVTEFDNHRISVYHKDGTYVTSMGKYGNQKGELCYPVGVTMDSNGFMYVCDQGNNRIQVF